MLSFKTICVDSQGDWNSEPGPHFSTKGSKHNVFQLPGKLSVVLMDKWKIENRPLTWERNTRSQA